MRFIDLFAGLGGFHVGLNKLGHQCVFASEIDPSLRKLYEKNHGIKPHGDITKISVTEVPDHDILCAGFPCQPFSKAGRRPGSDCPKAGKLIDDVFRIIEHHNPTYVFLENVPEIQTIQNGEFWDYILRCFKKNGYEVNSKVMSPHNFGIPQNRKRIFVLASKKKLETHWPTETPTTKNLFDLLDTSPYKPKVLEKEKIKVLNLWQKFLDNTKLSITCKTILVTEFGANYPIEDLNNLSFTQLKNYRGVFGEELSSSSSRNELLSKLPHYVKNGIEVTPWLKDSVIYSRKIYNENRVFLDTWKKEMLGFPNSWQKMDWQGNRQNLMINNHIVQFRASGIRVKKPDIAPSLISMTPTQTPIIPRENRYLTVREASRLQSMQSLDYFPQKFSEAFKSLGNAVNAHLVYLVANQLIKSEVKI